MELDLWSIEIYLILHLIELNQKRRKVSMRSEATTPSELSLAREAEFYIMIVKAPATIVL